MYDKTAMIEETKEFLKKWFARKIETLDQL